jgi:hypothetical protein
MEDAQRCLEHTNLPVLQTVGSLQDAHTLVESLSSLGIHDFEVKGFLQWLVTGLMKVDAIILSSNVLRFLQSFMFVQSLLDIFYSGEAWSLPNQNHQASCIFQNFCSVILYSRVIVISIGARFGTNTNLTSVYLMLLRTL